MKVLITGIAGFIGSNLADYLLLTDPDVEIIGIDNFTDYYDEQTKRSNIQQFDPARVTLIEGDLTELDLSPILAQVSHVYHQAGQPGVRKSWGSDFSHYIRGNIDATQRLLEAAMGQQSIEAFVYASSSSVYGDAEAFPTSEEDCPQPRSPYGVTKLAAEHLCSLYAANFGVPTVSLRYFTVYGPRQRPDMAFNKFISAALNDHSLPLYGSGEQIREFTFVQDIVRANVLAAQIDTAPGTVINLSGGASVSVNQVIAVLEQIHGVPIRVDRSAAVPGDVFRTGGSTDRAKALLGWKPEVALEDGLKSEYEWLKARKLEGALRT